MSKYIASVSFGKDSLAMLHYLINTHAPLDEVVFYDTGAEFDAIYAERDKMLPLLRSEGIEYVEMRPDKPFFYQMFATPVKERRIKEFEKQTLFNRLLIRAGLLEEGKHYGYGWCGGSCRWGTTYKIAALDRYAKENDAIVYVGIAADETDRIAKERAPYKRMPLVKAGMTEADCLELCKLYGHEWREGDLSLYDYLDRVSCWCCANKNIKELKAIHDHFPKYWERLVAIEGVLGNMKSKPLNEVVS